MFKLVTKQYLVLSVNNPKIFFSLCNIVTIFVYTNYIYKTKICRMLIIANVASTTLMY